MKGTDRRSSTATAAILGYLAEHYNPAGSTYSELMAGSSQVVSPHGGSFRTSARNLMRYVASFFAKGWIERFVNDRKARVKITPKGYFHYHREVLKRDVSSVEAVPPDLLPLLMVKGVWRLTEDQERYVRDYMKRSGSLLVLLPTGAGKTLIATIEAYRAFLDYGPEVKVLYASPYKAINYQTLLEFQKVLVPLSLKVVRQDGDYHPPEDELGRANLVVSTFESAEIALRQRQPWMEKVRLVIVDELTTLDSTRDAIESEPSGGPAELPRGATLDLFVTSMMYFFRESRRDLKVVCLGIPNSDQPALQRWLGKDTAVLEPSSLVRYEEKVAVFKREEGSRKLWLLRKDGSTYDGPWPSDALSSYDKVIEVVVHYLKEQDFRSGTQRPILVFVLGRKSASEIARRMLERIRADKPLFDAMSRGREKNGSRVLASAVVPTYTVRELADVVNHGVGFHHAGLFAAQRKLVEEMMNEGSLSVLFATTTLSHGVDFPIGAVIVDGKLLRFFRFSRLEYLQIRGRVDHKDPFRLGERTSDVVTVLGDDRLLEDYEKVQELLLGSDQPVLNSMSLDPVYIGSLAFKAIQAMLSTDGAVSAEALSGLVSSSYDYHRRIQGNSDMAKKLDGEVDSVLKAQLKMCVGVRIVINRNGKLTLGLTGELARSAGLSLDDVILTLSNLQALARSPEDRLDRLLVRMAASLSEGGNEVREVATRIFVYDDLPIQLRVGSEKENRDVEELRRNTLLGIMGRWTEEESVNRVVVNTPRFQIYEAGLLTSARALSRNLRKIERLTGLLSSGQQKQANDLRRVSRRAAALSIRLRFGVRDDVASSEIGAVAYKLDMDDLVNKYGYPELLARVVLRILVDKGVTTGEAARRLVGRKAVTLGDLKRYKLDPELATHTARFRRPMVDEIASRIVVAASKSVGAA